MRDNLLHRLKKYGNIKEYSNDVLSLPEYDMGNSIIYIKSDLKTGDFVKYGEDEKIPLTFEITGNGAIIWKSAASDYTKTVQYSKNGGEWVNITSTASGTSIDVVSGDVVRFRGNNAQYSTKTKWVAFNGTTCGFRVYGNIMSLINNTGFATSSTLTEICTFKNLFSGCTGLVSAENLILPATALTESCYQSMFSGCINLTATPVLPATTMVKNCYYSMFSDCVNLVTTPELPAVTMAKSCYSYMFCRCTNLSTTSKLPATTMAENCYYGMFYGCTNLIATPELPATTLGEYCYGCMFSGCTSLMFVSTLPATTFVSGCYALMFWGCTSLTAAPELPSATLADRCYLEMFNGCTNLSYIKCLAKTHRCKI